MFGLGSKLKCSGAYRDVFVRMMASSSSDDDSTSSDDSDVTSEKAGELLADL